MSEEAVLIEAVLELLQQLLEKTGSADTSRIEEYLDGIERDTDKIEEHTAKAAKDTHEIQLDVARLTDALDHPALTTSFADYTVSEALLLLLLLSAFLSACARMLRGGFSWLR